MVYINELKMQVIDYCKINCSLLLISVVKLQTKNNSQDYKIINRRFYTFKKTVLI